MKTIAVEPATTGIGSLPHHNIDAALEYSFRHTIPFLPQIPLRNPWEFMIAQALEGLPGLRAEADGNVTLKMDVWAGRSHAFSERLQAAFRDAARPMAFEAFEPSSATSSGWQPFLWELSERGTKTAKVQIAGPLTCQWALRTAEGTPIDRHPDLASQVYQLILARALAMARRLKADGISPLLYLDEPGLYALNLSDPRHAATLQELKLVVQALRKEGVAVGIHCCSNTDWKAVLGVGMSLLSIDTHLSLPRLLDHAEELKAFLRQGGRLSLGVIPSPQSQQELESFDPASELGALLDALSRALDSSELVHQALSRAVFTPACGLAYHSPSGAEAVFEKLDAFREFAARALERTLR